MADHGGLLVEPTDLFGSVVGNGPTQLSQLLGKGRSPWMKTTGVLPLALA
jgi:hypothetical protein